MTGALRPAPGGAVEGPTPPASNRVSVRDSFRTAHPGLGGGRPHFRIRWPSRDVATITELGWRVSCALEDENWMLHWAGLIGTDLTIADALARYRTIIRRDPARRLR